MKAFSPLLFFFVAYVGGSILLHDFYAIPIIVAFVAASLYALFVFRTKPFNNIVMAFARGAGNENIMYMILIFILAGAFASLAKSIGAIDATVNLCLYFLPTSLLLPGLFIATCLVSMSIGTSVGSIVAMVPLAAGLATQTGNSVALYTACIVGGAFFGDNLSFISDTTIVATRTQGIAMHEKFKANLRIVLPAALIAMVIYAVIGFGSSATHSVDAPDIVRVLPYLVVLVTAICGFNVIVVLAIGLLLCSALALGLYSLTITSVMQSVDSGVKAMCELIVVTMLAGGLMEMVRINGGIDSLMNKISRRIKNRQGAELSIGALVVLADFCTANNTIAILTVSSIAKQIAERFGIAPQRVASLLDTWSCFAQSLIPYGAQLLIASGLAGIAPTQIIQFLFYPFVLALVTLGSSLVKKGK
ncbi:MAG: Na+/H+ antiporter NhaC family protein [Salinivirgaceae bacterium]|nr:Na+/H+ antiporter NhaC family protein [Salinivirgaceae bacterium]